MRYAAYKTLTWWHVVYNTSNHKVNNRSNTSIDRYTLACLIFYNILNTRMDKHVTSILNHWLAKSQKHNTIVGPCEPDLNLC